MKSYELGDAYEDSRRTSYAERITQATYINNIFTTCTKFVMKNFSIEARKITYKTKFALYIHIQQSHGHLSVLRTTLKSGKDTRGLYITG